eukprot:scaffold508146_cov43-Prasinocladus_malaysianus.AAC.1
MQSNLLSSPLRPSNLPWHSPEGSPACTPPSSAWPECCNCRAAAPLGSGLWTCLGPPSGVSGRHHPPAARKPARRQYHFPPV